MERALADQVRPLPRQLDPRASASRWTEISRFNRSTSASGILAIRLPSASALRLKTCQEEYELAFI